MSGTHSKWGRLQGHVVPGFRKVMTGEPHGLVPHRSLARRLADGRRSDHDASVRGMVGGRGGDAFAALFSVRSAILTGWLDPRDAASLHAGICIAAEIASGL